MPEFFNNNGARKLIDQKLYFEVHSPRQSDRTTTLSSLATALTDEGRYAAVLLPMKLGAPLTDIGTAELAVLGSWRDSADACLPADLQPPPWPDTPPGARIGAALRVWSRASPRPLVVFLDDVDALQDNTLNSTLSQIRAGFPTRPTHFPWSLVVAGSAAIRERKSRPTSAFNVMAESLTLRQCTTEEDALRTRR